MRHLTHEAQHDAPHSPASTPPREMSQQSSIPTVDLTPFLTDEGIVVGAEPTPAQVAAASQINDACRDHGFVNVINFGVSPATEAAAFAASSALFAQPETHKLEKLARITPQTNTGFSPFAFEALNRARPPDLKEAFNVRDPTIHSNDWSGCPDGFEAAALALWAELTLAARRYAIACALALGLESDYFARSLARMDLCTLRFLHYPPCDMPSEGAVEGGGVASAPASSQLEPAAEPGTGCRCLAAAPALGGAASGGWQSGWVSTRTSGPSPSCFWARARRAGPPVEHVVPRP